MNRAERRRQVHLDHPRRDQYLQYHESQGHCDSGPNHRVLLPPATTDCHADQMAEYQEPDHAVGDVYRDWSGATFDRAAPRKPLTRERRARNVRSESAEASWRVLPRTRAYWSPSPHARV